MARYASNDDYCDICQEVCPWNGFATPASDPAFIPREGMEGPSLIEWMGMSQEESRVARGG